MLLSQSAARVEVRVLDRSAAFASWLRAHLAIALAVFGLALYGVLRIDYLLFFNKLGLNPEDVGLGYSEGLVQSAIAAFAITVLVLAVPLFLILFLFALLILTTFIGLPIFALVFLFYLVPLLALYPVYFEIFVRGKEGRTVRGDLGKLVGVSLYVSTYPFRIGTRLLRGFVKWLRGDPRRPSLVLMFVALLTALLVLVSLPFEAKRAADQVRSGQKVHLSLLMATLLPIRATPAEVFWADRTEASDVSVRQGECLLWLGTSGGTAVLYDFRSDQAVRLPLDRIIVHHRESCLGH
jgi:hypothetical protein